MNYDAACALIVVDMQNDFADPGGSLYVRQGETIVERINDEIKAAKEASATIVYTRDSHPPSTPHFEKDGGLWPVHCVADTWGFHLYPDLRMEDGISIYKGTGTGDGYSAFSDRDPDNGTVSTTDLAEQLRERGISRVVVVGLALDYCVKATALDSVAMGFDTTVIAAATRSVDLADGDGERAVQELRNHHVAIA